MHRVRVTLRTAFCPAGMHQEGSAHQGQDALLSVLRTAQARTLYGYEPRGWAHGMRRGDRSHVSHAHACGEHVPCPCVHVWEE